MFKKVEIWVLYLVIILFIALMIITLIGFGALVKHEITAPKSRFPILSSLSLKIAEIPSKFKNTALGAKAKEQRFQNISGFQGKKLENEAYLLLSRHDGDSNKPIVEIIDLRTFLVKYSWRQDEEKIDNLTDFNSPEWKNVANRYGRILHPILTDDGGIIIRSPGTPLTKFDANNQLVWLFQKDKTHHSIEFDHEGNLWTPTHSFPYVIDKKYVGSDYGNFIDESISKISPNGELLFQKSLIELFLENKLEHLIFHQYGDTFHKDPLHLNDIQPILSDGPHWQKGDLFLSLRHQSMVMLYRPSTNKILWKSVGDTVGQHDIDILDDHRISIFNNNVKNLYKGQAVDGHNEVLIYDFQTNLYSKYLNDGMIKYDVRTISEGRSQILDNEDLFIEESDYGRLLYFNKDKSLRWQYVNRAKNGLNYLLGWSRILYLPEDIKKVNELLRENI